MRGMKRITIAVALVLAAAGCSSDEAAPITTGADPTPVAASPVTTATTTTMTSTTMTTSTTTPPVDLAAIVFSGLVVPEGMEPVQGESGEVTVDVLPEGSALRVMLEEFGAVRGHAAIFAADAGAKTVVVIAVRFDSTAGAQAAWERFQEIGAELAGADGPVLATVTGDPLLGTCATIERLDLADEVILAAVDTSPCHTAMLDIPAIQMMCPETLAAGETGEVTVVVPSHYEPFEWQVGTEYFWLESRPISVVESSDEDGLVTATVVVEPEFSGDDRDTKLGARLFTHSIVDLFGDRFRIEGPRVPAECTITATKGS